MGTEFLIFLAVGFAAQLIDGAALAGATGAIISVYVLSNIDGRMMRPFVAAISLCSRIRNH